MKTLDEALGGSRYQGYLYAYPHKTAYRPLDPPQPLAPLWAGERRDRLFLYLHVPFCEMRCGFCNLFTRPLPDGGEDDRVAAYVATLERQARVVRRCLDEGDAAGPARFARAAIGGGTPTFLSPALLERLVAILAILGAEPGIPLSVETSPATATRDRIGLLVAAGADRISIGVQSFVDDECRAVGRPQRAAEVHRALDTIRAAGGPALNVDLMYGLPGQTAASWRASLDAALGYRPEEIYLYPTYARPLTPLGKRAARRGDDGDDARPGLYAQGREHLLAAGYAQVSMRMFRRRDAGDGAATAPVYCCQDDGMVGLGCGARSYTRGLHYACDYAVGARGVRAILDRWIARDESAFARADHGIALDAAEQRRRWLILSILSDQGADGADYARRFGGDLAADAPELDELAARGLAVRDQARWQLTARGVACSDVIGPWLVSAPVRALMAGWEGA